MRRMTSKSLVVLLLVASACGSGGDGSIRVVSFPRGRVVIDGRTTDLRTPLTSHRIASGRHEISIVAEGVRFRPQSIEVRRGRTSYLYFRARDPAVDASPTEICRTGRQDHCIARIEASLRERRTDEARELARVALSAHPTGGYEVFLRQIVTRLGGDAGPTPMPDE